MRKRWNEETIKQYIEKFGYKVINIKPGKNQKSINIQAIIKIKCPYCGDIFEVIMTKFVNRNKRCWCEKHWTIEKIQNLFVNSKYKLIDILEFNGSLSKLLIKCSNKKHTPYEIYLYNFIRNHECQECIRENMIIWKKEKIINYIESYGFTIIKFLKGEGLKTRLLIQCKEKHEPYEVRFDNFITGYRCPYCNNLSRGEEKINNLLNHNDILFHQHYSFEDCKNKLPLPFDFYLPKYNTCIEYDGQQHYKIDCFNNTLLDLMNSHYRDNIKTNYCQQNNIKLIRIPYWDFDNIENILSQFIK